MVIFDYLFFWRKNLMRSKWLTLLLTPLLILTASNDVFASSHTNSHRNSWFDMVFTQPIDMLLHGLGHLYGENYGLAIITIVIIIRLIIMPLMVMQVKSMHMMREKTKVVQPHIDELKKQAKDAKHKEEKQEVNKALSELYKKYGISPFKNMVGCLPIFIQLPILFGLIQTLKYPSGGGIEKYPNFLWFDLTEPNLWISLIAAIIYFFQPLVNSIHYPKDQRKTYYFMMIASPIIITYISLQSASALGLYWTVGGLFLIIQMHLAHGYYNKKAKKEAAELEDRIKKAEARDETN